MDDDDLAFDDEDGIMNEFLKEGMLQKHFDESLSTRNRILLDEDDSVHEEESIYEDEGDDIDFEELEEVDYDQEEDFDEDDASSLMTEDSIGTLSDVGDEQMDSESTSAMLRSLESIIPEAFTNHEPTNLPKGTRQRMTDLGFRMSKMVLLQQGSQEGAKKHNDFMIEDDSSTAAFADQGPDPLLERHLLGRRRNKPGVRGRPKKEDHGFGSRSKSQHYPPEVAKLMGTANQAYVSRSYAEAIPCLLEVVRRVPDSFEPYHTLGLIYEEQGVMDKAFSYYLIAAHLCKRDPELWHHAGQLALELKRMRDAVYCISRLLRLSPQEDLFWTRARLWLDLGEYRMAVVGFVPLIKLRLCEGEEENGDQAMELTVKIARLAISLRLGGVLGKMLEQILSHSTRRLRWSTVGLLLDLYLSAEHYDQTLNAIERFAPVLAAPTLGSATDWLLVDQTERVRRSLAHLPAEIQGRQAIAQVRSGRSSLVDLARLNQQLTDHANLRLLLGQAYLLMKMWADALSMFLPLLDVPSLGNVQLCVCIGRCYEQLGRNEEASEILEAACQFDPTFALATSLRDAIQAKLAATQGKSQKDPHRDTDFAAILRGDPRLGSVLLPDQDPEAICLELFGYRPNLGLSGPVQTEDGDDCTATLILDIPRPKQTSNTRPPLHLRKRRRKRIKPVLYTAEQCAQVRLTWSSVMSMLSEASPGDQRTSYRAFLDAGHSLIEDLSSNSYLIAHEKDAKPSQFTNVGATHGLSVDEWFKLLQQTIIARCLIGDIDRAIRLIRLFLSRSVFALDTAYSVRLRLLLIGCCCGSPNSLQRMGYAMAAVRWFMRVWPTRALPHILAGAILQPGAWGNAVFSDAKHERFLRRMASKQIDDGQSSVVFLAYSGHVHLNGGAYDEAIRDYQQLVLATLTDPETHRLAIMYLAMAYMHSAFRRTCRQPKQQIFAAMALFHQARANDQLGHFQFNLARGLHGAGFLNLAAQEYTRLIASNSIYRRDAAYNLHLIYLSSGSPDLARKILHEHCRI